MLYLKKSVVHSHEDPGLVPELYNIFEIMPCKYFHFVRAYWQLHLPDLQAKLEKKGVPKDTCDLTLTSVT